MQTLPPEVQAALVQWDADNRTALLWAKDPSLWPGTEASKWLGWLDAIDTSDEDLDALTARVNAAACDTRDVLLIGMGGSSLAPEVIAKIMPHRQHGRVLRVLDSTEPSAVTDAFDRTNWAATTVVVASKSGSTLEPDILLAAAFERARTVLGANAARHFIAITDPGSKLNAQAQREGFAEIFEGVPSIGGRFSALSPFGLVPAALHGADLRSFMERAREMAFHCRSLATSNPGSKLGAFLAVNALAGRDKCTLLMPDAYAPLGAWIEQLIAESTGKHGKGIIPIDGEPLQPELRYGSDRMFICTRSDATDSHHDDIVKRLRNAGHPVYTVDADGPESLPAEFFRWEFATAVAGSLMQLDPFDQPDVESAKIATRAITDAQERGEPAAPSPSASADEIRALLASIKPGDYVGVLAFLPMNPGVVDSLRKIRTRIRDKHGVATTVGFGPRFLHSTGQLFKGGPNSGVFIQLTHDAPRDIPVPGRKLTFGAVCAAQAAGDLKVLRKRGRRAVHVQLIGGLHEALESLLSVL